MRKTRQGHILDYATSVLMIAILVLGAFLMPSVFSRYTDNKDLSQVYVADRERFSFESPVDMAVGERVQNMMESLESRSGLSKTLFLSGMEITDGELMAGIRESANILAQYNLMPDISGYDLAGNIIYAEYYNLSNNATESAEAAFWNLRFSDYETFDFTLRVDASEYVIYQAELYCVEATAYLEEITSDDLDVVGFYNRQFMEGCSAYFEAEGYDALTDLSESSLAFRMGYERGQYSVYHAPCNDSVLKIEGIRWGFVPMTVALEKGGAFNEWGYDGIVSYYKRVYDIEIYESKGGQ